MCEFLAKQLWLTTPLAMKSPVPVVMSYIGTSSPSRSTSATRSPSWVPTGVPSIAPGAVLAGSTAWKNLSAWPGLPPSRTPAGAPRRWARSPAASRPSDRSEEISQSAASGSAGQIRRTPSR